jgi:hypothetical protein
MTNALRAFVAACSEALAASLSAIPVYNLNLPFARPGSGDVPFLHDGPESNASRHEENAGREA